MNKSEFLQTLRAERARLDEKLSRLSHTEMAQRAAPGDWSIADALAHLTFWEQFMLDKVRGAVHHGETPQWMDHEAETAANAGIYQDNLDRPPANILADMRRSLTEVIAVVEALPEDDLTAAGRFPWLNGRPLWDYIAEEAYGEHYHEHLGDKLP